jgi:hypothetical protein
MKNTGVGNMGVYFIDPKTLVDTKFLFLMEHGAVQATQAAV